MWKRILVGPGGTDHTVAAINQAVSRAMDLEAELTGVCFIDPSRVVPVKAMPIGEWAIANPETDRFTATARE